MEQREMNFWDLCVACGRAIGRGLKALWNLFSHMLRLTVRFWWIVLPIWGLAAAAGIYCTRYEKMVYKVSSIAYLNGPSVQQFEQAFSPLRTAVSIPQEAAASYFVYNEIATHFDSYRVIDAKNDGVPDYIDFEHKASYTDTLRVPMEDRMCIQFRVKANDLEMVPDIEKAVLDYLNANEAMQASYRAYKANLEEKVAFNHKQAAKLDSLTSVFYFNTIAQKNSLKPVNGEWMPSTESKINLFLEDIYDQQEKMEKDDYRMQLATAPVTLENHFAAEKKPLNSRREMFPRYFLLGWLLGCLLAQIVYKRKTIYAWLKL